MKKIRKVVSIAIVFLMIISMVVGCDNNKNSLNSENIDIKKENTNESTLPEGYNTADDVIHIWKYKSGSTCKNTTKLLPLIEEYCKNNNIPYQLHCYDENEITLEDYMLKRNINLNNPNTIVFGGRVEFSDGFNVNHADYTKIERFENIADSCKDLPYILIAYNSKSKLVNKKLLDYYNVKYDKDIMYKSDYHKIITELNKNGAKLNNDFEQYVLERDYLFKKYNLALSCDDTGEKIDNIYKENLKQAITEMIEFCKDKPFLLQDYIMAEPNIIDENTNMKMIVGYGFFDYHCYYRLPDFIDSTEDNLVYSLKDTILYYEPNYVDYGIFVGDNIKNEAIYDVVNYMMGSQVISSYSRSYRFTLKNDISDELYYKPETLELPSSQKTYDYCKRNITEIERIDKAMNESIFNGNLEEEFVFDLINQTYTLSSSVSSGISIYARNIIRRVYKGEEPNIEESTQNFFDNDLEEFIAQLKLKM